MNWPFFISKTPAARAASSFGLEDIALLCVIRSVDVRPSVPLFTSAPLYFSVRTDCEKMFALWARAVSNPERSDVSLLESQL
jgi:hypothetical protein